MSAFNLTPAALALLLAILPWPPHQASAEDMRWALSPEACSGELATREETPLIFDGAELRWFSFACAVISRYKVKETFFVQAECRSMGKATTIPVMLEPAGEELRVGWNREPVRKMQRCPIGPLGY